MRLLLQADNGGIVREWIIEKDFGDLECRAVANSLGESVALAHKKEIDNPSSPLAVFPIIRNCSKCESYAKKGNECCGARGMYIK
jgi:hypothetical protein